MTSRPHQPTPNTPALSPTHHEQARALAEDVVLEHGGAFYGKFERELVQEYIAEQAEKLLQAAERAGADALRERLIEALDMNFDDLVRRYGYAEHLEALDVVAKDKMDHAIAGKLIMRFVRAIRQASAGEP